MNRNVIHNTWIFPVFHDWKGDDGLQPKQRYTKSCRGSSRGLLHCAGSVSVRTSSGYAVGRGGLRWWIRKSFQRNANLKRRRSDSLCWDGHSSPSTRGITRFRIYPLPSCHSILYGTDVCGNDSQLNHTESSGTSDLGSILPHLFHKFIYFVIGNKPRKKKSIGRKWLERK